MASDGRGGGRLPRLAARTQRPGDHEYPSCDRAVPDRGRRQRNPPSGYNGPGGTTTDVARRRGGGSAPSTRGRPVLNWSDVTWSPCSAACRTAFVMASAWAGARRLESSTALGRNLAHLVNTVQDLSARGEGLRALAGQGAQIDTTTAAGRLVFGIFAALAGVRAGVDPRTHRGRAQGRTGPRTLRRSMTHPAGERRRGSARARPAPAWVYMQAARRPASAAASGCRPPPSTMRWRRR